MYMVFAVLMLLLTLPAGTHHYITTGNFSWFLGLGLYFAFYIIYTWSQKKKSTYTK